jgi:hypothetical protein
MEPPHVARRRASLTPLHQWPPSPIGRGAGGEGLETDHSLRPSSRKNTSTADRSLFDIDANMKVFKNPRLKVISHRKKVRGAQALTPTPSQKEGARMKCGPSLTGWPQATYQGRRDQSELRVR